MELHGTFMGALHKNLVDWEKICTLTPRLKTMHDEIDGIKRTFTDKMTQDELRRFEAYENLVTELEVEGQCEIYAYGFTHGAMLMLEIMQNKETALKG